MEEIILSPPQDKKRKVIKRMVIGFFSLIMLLVLLFMSVTIIYPVILRSIHRIDTPNGIDSMEVVEIGGIQQALYFRGQNVENPVILVLHGGFGMPDMAMLHNYQFELEDYFTLVRWDQRNAGRTFFLNNPKEVLETLTFERAVNDAYEVTQYIRERLNADQIIVLAHSAGSTLATALVQQYPQYFSAYIPVGQVVNRSENEQLGFEALLETARAGGSRRSITAVEELGPPPLGQDFGEGWWNYIREIQTLMARYGYSTSPSLLAWLTMTSPYYTLREKMYFITVDVSHYHFPLHYHLFREDFDIRNFGTDFQIPVFFITGELDRVTSYQLARGFYEEISAPYKAFFSIPNAGHMPMHENTVEYIRVLIEEIRPLIEAR